MKYMDIPNINVINSLFSSLNFLNPKQSLEFEVYSCKQTKLQKRHLNLKKPLRFYVSALEESFIEYDFSNEQGSSFTRTTYEHIRNEMAYYFLALYKNSFEVERSIAKIEYVLNHCIQHKKASCFLVENSFYNELEIYRIYLLHNKNCRRVILIKFKTLRDFR